MTSEFSWFIELSLVTIAISLILATIRLVQGPTLPDRVVALDFLAVAGVTGLGLLAHAHDRVEFLDIAGGLALIAFVSTVGFARYLERKCLP